MHTGESFSEDTPLIFHKGPYSEQEQELQSCLCAGVSVMFESAVETWRPMLILSLSLVNGIY